MLRAVVFDAGQAAYRVPAQAGLQAFSQLLDVLFLFRRCIETGCADRR